MVVFVACTTPNVTVGVWAILSLKVIIIAPDGFEIILEAQFEDVAKITPAVPVTVCDVEVETVDAKPEGAELKLKSLTCITTSAEIIRVNAASIAPIFATNILIMFYIFYTKLTT